MLTEKEVELARSLIFEKRKIIALINELKTNRKTLAICEPVHNHSSFNYNDQDTRLLKKEVIKEINMIALNALAEHLKNIENKLSVLVKT